MEALQISPLPPAPPPNSNPSGSDRGRQQPSFPSYSAPKPCRVVAIQSPALPKTPKEAATALSSRSNTQAGGRKKALVMWSRPAKPRSE